MCVGRFDFGLGNVHPVNDLFLLSFFVFCFLFLEGKILKRKKKNKQTKKPRKKEAEEDMKIVGQLGLIQMSFPYKHLKFIIFFL